MNRQFPSPVATDDLVVHLFEGPYVTCRGTVLAVPQGSKRLLAFVALRKTRVRRPYAAGTLWPFGDDDRASGNLRSALWRLRRAGIEVLVADKWSLGLADNVVVDIELLSDWTSRLIHGTADPGDLTLDRIPGDALNLLPGWYDDWAIVERERIRQRTLHAIEALSRLLTGQGRYAEAIEVALRVIAVEPLRETAQRVLIEAYISQGNLVEADRSFTAFRSMLQHQLGVEPSGRLLSLMTAGPHAALTYPPVPGAQPPPPLEASR